MLQMNFLFTVLLLSYQVDKCMPLLFKKVRNCFIKVILGKKKEKLNKIYLSIFDIINWH